MRVCLCMCVCIYVCMCVYICRWKSNVPASQIEGGVRVDSYEAHLLPINVPWTRLCFVLCVGTGTLFNLVCFLDHDHFTYFVHTCRVKTERSVKKDDDGICVCECARAVLCVRACVCVFERATVRLCAYVCVSKYR